MDVDEKKADELEDKPKDIPRWHHREIKRLKTWQKLRGLVEVSHVLLRCSSFLLIEKKLL